MSRFRIHKTGDPYLPWAMDYPPGFRSTSGYIGVACSTFEFAVAAFIDAVNATKFAVRAGL